LREPRRREIGLLQRRLAIRIIEKKVSGVLFDKRVVSLDLAYIVAGTKYRGQFEEVMKAILMS
jgi:ATP-dependent Clp protease ATP-binding subunit ClpC